ncbi:hypothetical protein QBC39DRAFT_337105 [Podospora conica]|nr:hypothetical protein QBC39DRAFT_337105 [Schizothecium conicum]
MYKWYQDAAICFAYLSDVPCFSETEYWSLQGELFMESRWFERGWTLQELLAPRELVFFSDEWDAIGDRETFAPLISIVTRIDTKFLHGNAQEYFDQASIAEKMDWAATRETTKAEDMAYCLLGILGINMPLLYGEGRGAFIRLQEELIKHSDDQSIFAWGCQYDEPAGHGFLAESPVSFYGCSWIESRGSNSNREPFSLTNLGISIKAPCWVDLGLPGASHWYMMLRCGPKSDPTRLLALPIDRIQGRGELFSRRQRPVTIQYSTCIYWQPRSISLSVRRDKSPEGRGLSSTPVWIKSIPPGYRCSEFYPPAEWSQARMIHVPAPGFSTSKPFCKIQHLESGSEVTLLLINSLRFKSLAYFASTPQPVTRIKCILLPPNETPETFEAGTGHYTWSARQKLMYIKTNYEAAPDGPVLAISVEETASEQRNWVLVQDTFHHHFINLVDIYKTLAWSLPDEDKDMGERGLLMAVSYRTVIGWDGYPLGESHRTVKLMQFFIVAGLLFFSLRHKGIPWPPQLIALLIVDVVFLFHHHFWTIHVLDSLWVPFMDVLEYSDSVVYSLLNPWGLGFINVSDFLYCLGSALYMRSISRMY